MTDYLDSWMNSARRQRTEAERIQSSYAEAAALQNRAHQDLRVGAKELATLAIRKSLSPDLTVRSVQRTWRKPFMREGRWEIISDKIAGKGWAITRRNTPILPESTPRDSGRPDDTTYVAHGILLNTDGTLLLYEGNARQPSQQVIEGDARAMSDNDLNERREVRAAIVEFIASHPSLLG